MFLFCRQFCSWVPSRMGIPFASPWEEEFSRLGNARGPYHWAVKWNKLYVINRWQGRFSPTLCKWWQDAARHGLHPTGRRLMWDPRAVWAVLHRHRLQAAGCLCLGHCAGFVSLKYEEDAFTLFPGTLTLSAFFHCHPWNGRWLHPPVKLPMGLPSRNDVGLAPGWWFGTGSSAEASLTQTRCPASRTDRTCLTLRWQSAWSMAGKRACFFPARGFISSGLLSTSQCLLYSTTCHSVTRKLFYCVCILY